MKGTNISSAVSSMHLEADKNAVWNKVGFYEHVQKKPSFLLRLSLPIPQEVEGNYSKVGDTCRCKYSDGGYLTKRITRIADQTRIEFEIIEQSIRYQNTVKLLGGYIEVKENGAGRSIVNMVTFYENWIQPKKISAYFINKVIKTMHQFVMHDMQAQLQPQQVSKPAVMPCA